MLDENKTVLFCDTPLHASKVKTGFLQERRTSWTVVAHVQIGRTAMDREHVKGAADKAKGAIKEGAGKLTGDKEMEAEGKIDKAKGSAHNAAGDVKDAARNAADAMKK
jgi:uncharacterized protein YjbJ (UPF0337 family)